MADSRISRRPSGAHAGAIKSGPRLFWVLAVPAAANAAITTTDSIAGFDIVERGWAMTTAAAERATEAAADTAGLAITNRDCAALAKTVHRHLYSRKLPTRAPAAPLKRPQRNKVANTKLARPKPTKPARAEPSLQLFRWRGASATKDQTLLWEQVRATKITDKTVYVAKQGASPVRISRTILEREGSAWSRLNGESYFLSSALAAEEARRRKAAREKRRKPVEPVTRDIRRLGLRPGYTAADVHAAFRRLAHAAHPDRGGSDDAMRELIAARNAALAELHLDTKDAPH